MHNESTIDHAHHHDSDSTDIFGFWLYIMTDCILFGTLFATFIVLNLQGHPSHSLHEHVNLMDILIETFLLLASNFTFCLAILSIYQNNRLATQSWLAVTFLLGGAFVFLEVSEFIHLAHVGFRWDFSAQASSFFTLVGTHGLHVSFGLLWIFIMIIQIPRIIAPNIIIRRMTYLGLFWNFLDIVWIFVFTIVYLIGALQ